MDTISVGLLGLGTVGCGAVKIIDKHQDQLIHQIGCPIQIKKILVKDLEKKRGVEVPKEKLTLDPSDILHDPEIDVVIEVMGGIEETKEILLGALQNKKHVVTANKDLMALYGPGLLETAAANGCDLFYEASVAGGIPILRGLTDGLASDRITKMMGIVNGTTNFILTRMSQNGSSYEEALREAQQLGFAEADPAADVSGLDAARKMAILATLGFSMNIDLSDVSVQGITEITEEDLLYSSKLGYTMKLIGVSSRTSEKVEVSVQPALLPDHHPLASVHNEYNAIYVYGEAVGETMFYGPGAGSLPTATAVVSDLVAVVKNMRLGVNGRSAVSPQYPKTMKTPAEITAKFFIRLHVRDEVGVLAKITSLFAEHGVGFDKILQLPLTHKHSSEIVLVTHRASLEDFENIMQQIKDFDTVKEVKSTYRVEEENGK